MPTCLTGLAKACGQVCSRAEARSEPQPEVNQQVSRQVPQQVDRCETTDNGGGPVQSVLSPKPKLDLDQEPEPTPVFLDDTFAETPKCEGVRQVSAEVCDLELPGPVSAIPPEPACIPFFRGNWAGTRNDFTGEVGISFTANIDFTITALGRHVGDIAQDTVTVTLWMSDTQSAITSADVGPSSTREGPYAFEALNHCVDLKAGYEYRLSQRCVEKMLDPWFDGRATAQEAATQCASKYATFLGGVCRNGFGYPKRYDGEHRRPGMVNFKVVQQGLDIVPVTREEMAEALARFALAEEPMDEETANNYILVLSAVLTVLANELADVPGASAYVVVVPEDALGELYLQQCSTNTDLTSTGNGSTPSIFDARFKHKLASFAQSFRGRIDEEGGPMEGAIVLSHCTGQVVGAALQIFCNNAELLGAADLMTVLGRGMAFTRSEQGSITAFPGMSVRQGQALRIESAGAVTWQPLAELAAEVAEPATGASTDTGPTLVASSTGAGSCYNPSGYFVEDEKSRIEDEVVDPEPNHFEEQEEMQPFWLTCGHPGLNEMMRWGNLMNMKPAGRRRS